MIFHYNGGPGGGRQQDPDESYSEEEEEETSSTSVENSEDDEGEEEEEDDEEESEEEDTTSEDDDEDGDGEEEVIAQRRPTRNTSPQQQSSSASTSGSRLKGDVVQKGRFTRQKAREEMPTKRLLRSRKKSPVAGAGSKVPQVFKCPNCKKEFNNKVSLSRHTGWCKQKNPKGNSPRKKKGEDGNLKETGKKEKKIQNQSPMVSQIGAASSVPPTAPRGRGRPRKNPLPITVPTPSPSTSNVVQHPFQPQQPILQARYAEENMHGDSEHVTRVQEFMQIKSPDSSPGIMDTSSEEDYEQKEYAANAHQLISHRSSGSVSIDVVNPDPPPAQPPPSTTQSEGPVTCPQCKMTYRTLVGFQNHFPNCTPFSSDEDEEEGNDVDVVDEAPSFQQESRPNWTVYQTIPETVISPMPPPPEPTIVESSEEESTSSSDEDVVIDEVKTQSSNISRQDIETLPPKPPPVQLPPKKYQEISIASGKSPIKIILPPDNTPQVINASGLTLERLEMSPIPKTNISTNSPSRTASPARKCATPQSQQESRTPTPQLSLPLPPTPMFPSVATTHPSNSSTPVGLSQPLSTFSHLSSITQHGNIISQSPSPSIPVSSSSSTTSTTTIVPPTTAVSLSIPTLPTTVGIGNPPTYTQAQLMPGTVLHSTIMPVSQQMATSAGDAYHHHPHHSSPSVTSQPLSQFPGSHFPLGYTSQAPSVIPHSTFRVQNGVSSIHTSPAFSTNHPHSGMFVGANGGLESQHQIASVAQTQMLRHAIPDQQRLHSPAQPQLAQLPQGISTIPGQSAGQIPPVQQDQRGIPVPGQVQQPYIFTNTSGSSIGQFGMPTNSNHVQPATTFTVPPGGTQFPQPTNSQIPTNTMSFPPVHHHQHPQQLPHQSTGLNPQSAQFPPPQAAPGVGTLPNSLEGVQQFHAQSQLAQYSSYFQNPSASGFPKHSVENLGQSQQLPQVIQQQAMFNGSPQQIPTNPAGLPFPIQHQLQPQVSTSLQHISTLQQQQSALALASSMFQQQQSIQNSSPVPVQTPAGTTPTMPVFNIQQASESNSVSTSGSISTASQQQQHLNASMIQQGNVNSNLQPSQVEFNLQQQLQLQQQQQQFMALQQQLQLQQTSSDTNKSSNQPQFQPQNMQPVMINGTLQWAKTGQPAQQIQMPQQQPQLSSSAEVTTPSLTGQPQSAPQPQQTDQSAPIQQSSQPQQPTIPQVIQQFAQVTDNAGNTYIIMLPTQPQQQTVAQNGLTSSPLGGNNATQLLNIVPGLQGSGTPSQQLQRINQALSTNNCTATANGVVLHSPCSSSSSSPGTFNSVGKSAPCPCASCKEKTGTTSALDKYKKVLPYPSPNDPHHTQLKTTSPNIAPKQPISIRPALPKQSQPKVVRVQAAAAAARTPALQLAFAHSAAAAPTQSSSSQQPPGSQLKILPAQQQQVGIIGVAGANAPISSPNIAVVRPMENPLQRLSDQISQIESTFLSPSPSAALSPPQQHQIPSTTTTIVSQGSPPLGHHITLVTASPPPPSSTLTLQIPVTSISPSHPIPHHVFTLEPPPCDENPIGSSHQQVTETETPHLNIPIPRLTLVDHGIPPATQLPSSSASQSASSSPQLSSPSSSIQSISAPSTPVLNSNGSSTTSATSGVKRKILQVSPSSGGGGPAAKSIRLTLHKMGGGDTYSIKKIEGDSAKANGSFKSLKIKGRILSSRLTTGPQEGTATNVVIVPCIRIVPNPDPDTNEGNVTIAEDGSTNGSTNGDDSNAHRVGDNNNNGTNGSRTNLRLTHRAVIVYEGRMESNNKVLFQSSDVLDVWDRVFQIVQGTRLNHNLPPISYPATNIALPQNEMEAQAIFNKLGLTHRAIKFLLQKLPGLKALSQSQKNAKVPTPPPSPPLAVEGEPLASSSLVPLPSSLSGKTEQRNQNDDDEDIEEIINTNESGSARLERFTGRKSFDMFGWLTSLHRNPICDSDRPLMMVKDQLEQALKFLSAPLGMRYRKMKEKWREYLVIKKSDIHGIGLFTKRDIEKGEMIIEYAGEVIRPLVCDIREKYYESKAIGCYMFRINDHVIDATIKGNAARFINHSCEPNCEAKTVKISGKDHIIIFSLRRIQRGSELMYDYQFEKEEEKIPCSCKSKHCRKYLN